MGIKIGVRRIRRSVGHRPAQVALLVAIVAALAAVPAPTATAPAAAAAAAAAAANSKAGVASSRYLYHNPQKLVALGASWAYDWSPRLEPVDLGIQWVPMVWSAHYLTPEIITQLQIAKADRGVRYLLGFNEPDNRSQAHMTPEQAANLWPRLERTGLILGSPAPDTPTDGWLARFMHLAHRRHLRVNFIALHYYLDFTNPASLPAMQAQLIHVHDTYHLPIWITELGALDIRRWGRPMLHAPSQLLAQTYMRHVFRMLNRLKFVRRYAWFTDSCAGQPGCRYSSLFTARGALTPEGREFKRDA